MATAGSGRPPPWRPRFTSGPSGSWLVSTRYSPPSADAERPATHRYPPPAQILGPLLDAIFLDALDYDAHLVERINRLLASAPAGTRLGLRPIELFVLRPSRDLGRLAGEYEPELPRAFVS